MQKGLGHYTAVEPIMDNLMQGSTETDHAKHTRDFTDRMKCIVTPERLAAMCADYQSASVISAGGQCAEGDGRYADKALGLLRRADLPAAVARA